jgi:hypothetical protein
MVKVRNILIHARKQTYHSTKDHEHHSTLFMKAELLNHL